MSVIDDVAPERLKATLGRPTTFKPEYVQRAHKYALLGLKDYEIAHNFGIDISNLHEWLVQYPELRDAIHNGRDNADADTALSLFKRANGASVQATKILLAPGSTTPIIVEYTENYPPDTAAAFIWLKNRQPKLWRDKKELDVNMNVEHTMTPEVRTLMELMAGIAASDALIAQQTIEAQCTDITSLDDDATKK